MILPYINMNPPQVYTCSPSRTPLPPPSPYHPSGLSQCTSPKHPVSCIEPGLAIRFVYDIIHFNAILPNHPTLSLSHRVQKTILYFRVQLSHPYMSTRKKNIALTRQTFVDKVMSLLFNMLSRLVIAFLPRSKHLLISWLQSHLQ